MFSKPEVTIISFDYTEASILEEIQRNLGLLYSTAAGTCPGDREFGLDQTFESYPVNIAKNLFALEIIEKTEVYENRVKIQNIDYEYEEDGNLTPIITIGLKDIIESDET